MVRLIVLYKQGGMYIDFDTLPDFSHCFLECDEAYPDLAKLNISDVLKSEVILSKFSSKNNNIKLIVSSFFNEYNEYVESIMKAAQKLKLEDIFNDFVIPSVHFNLLSLSCAKNAFGEYNNNIIISHEKSKLISIIIMQMIKRYKFIIRCGALYSYKVELNMTNDDYFSRLINYRLDYIRTTNNVTLIVTGPSLILETLLGVSYKIFDIDDVEPLSVAVAFSNPNLKFAFVEQTQFTFEHMRSSWQANKNALTK
ncbi:TcdA/TcdB catalytic glycosyltransferase domain-containing protein [Vibrio sp. TRT 2004]|uniref:TcdA/TcdB catalytic glycosyltransferase domain-containing protein n=1 Tax=Vibrio sp. TRT 2004 TaxID=3418506 RepID=UPI003CEE5B2F